MASGLADPTDIIEYAYTRKWYVWPPVNDGTEIHNLVYQIQDIYLILKRKMEKK